MVIGFQVYVVTVFGGVFIYRITTRTCTTEWITCTPKQPIFTCKCYIDIQGGCSILDSRFKFALFLPYIIKVIYKL